MNANIKNQTIEFINICRFNFSIEKEFLESKKYIENNIFIKALILTVLNLHKLAF